MLHRIACAERVAKLHGKLKTALLIRVAHIDVAGNLDAVVFREDMAVVSAVVRGGGVAVAVLHKHAFFLRCTLLYSTFGPSLVPLIRMSTSCSTGSDLPSVTEKVYLPL